MTDEDRLLELLQTHQSLSDQIAVLAMSQRQADVERRSELEQQRRGAQDDILELVDKYFRQALRPVVAKVFGAGVFGKKIDAERRADDDLRYTAMVNDFFVKVLDKRPDAFWKAKTAAALRTWSSVVIANQMRDYLRRKKKGQQILAELALLVEQKQKYYEERHRTTFEEFLDQLAAWESSGDETLAQQTQAMRHRYVDGMKWSQIAEQLGITDERLTQLRQAAAERLRKL